MTTTTLRSAAVLLGSVVLFAALGGKLALAECPCFTSAQIDGWFSALPPPPDQPEQKPLCVDDAAFTTLDYLDPAVVGSIIYVDVRAQTKVQKARCLVDVTAGANELADSHGEISKAEAGACRREIMSSQVWKILSCPSH